jgi:hypothetical protein
MIAIMRASRTLAIHSQLPQSGYFKISRKLACRRHDGRPSLEFGISAWQLDRTLTALFDNRKMHCPCGAIGPTPLPWSKLRPQHVDAIKCRGDGQSAPRLSAAG